MIQTSWYSHKVGEYEVPDSRPYTKKLDRLKKIWDEWERQHLQGEITIDDYKALQVLDSSITNLSSIMFLVEFEGKRMLFTGHGLGSDIVESLSQSGLLDSQGKVHVDILKVPHHGSERNVSEQFFKTVTANTYVVSANGRDDNPSLSTLKWIIKSPRYKRKKMDIVVTNRTSNTDKARQEYAEEKFNYQFRFLQNGDNYIQIQLC